jgi:hypothetical protein
MRQKTSRSLRIARAALLVAAPFALTACGALLGVDFEGTLGEDGGGSDATRADGDDGGVSEDARGPADDGAARCVEGARTCDGVRPQVCRSGVWVDEPACTGATPLCRNGRCVDEGEGDAGPTPECGAGAKDCGGDGVTPRECVNGQWLERPQCAGATPICAAGACTATCSAGQRDCAGNVPRICSQGQWLPQSACSGAKPVCASGVCVECNESEAACANGQTPKLCVGGKWEVLSPCSGATPDCARGACVACAIGPVACENDQRRRICTASGYQSETVCASDTVNVCRGAACEACPAGFANCNGASRDGCETAYDTRCAPCGPGPRTCYRDADGDGYGTLGTTQVVCATACPAGWSANAGDCDDAAANVNPARSAYATSAVNGSWDLDCDGTITRAVVYSNGFVPIGNTQTNCASASTEAACGALPRWATNLTNCGASTVLRGCGWPVDAPGCKAFDLNTNQSARLGCR